MENELLWLLLALLASAVAMVLPWLLPALRGSLDHISRHVRRQVHALVELGRGRIKDTTPASPTTLMMARRAKSAPPLQRLKKGLERVRSTSGSTLKTLGYKVCLGDTLRVVAHEVLGDSERWFELWQLNRGVVHNHQLLVPGTVLRLPRGCVPPS
ncbi:MAG: hypothetical protein VYE15_01225 [Myxococcota bacterium]|nr:hypothetical protein [Myxococcota bacterium]